MRPDYELPLPDGYKDEERYVHDLLEFVGSSKLLQLLCGGVHILDFFTREPDLYQCLLPSEWRDFFDVHDLQDLLDLFLREDLESISHDSTWREKPSPPVSLISYLSKIRRLALTRDFDSSALQNPQGLIQNGKSGITIPPQIAVGMKAKKLHEVDHFARFINDFISDVELRTGRPVTHVVDFGSGQNYLGRTLASPPYNRHVVAVESKHANVEGAKAMDVHANLATKAAVMRNKKAWRVEYSKKKNGLSSESKKPCVIPNVRPDMTNGNDIASSGHAVPASTPITRAILSRYNSGGGSIQYVEHQLQDGDLAPVIEGVIPGNTGQIGTTERSQEQHFTVNGAEGIPDPPNLIVISLHSCGNLTHHGLRSLMLNPYVAAVALVGCCYNLVTERFSAPTYKIPNLRPTPVPSQNFDPPEPARISNPKHNDHTSGSNSSPDADTTDIIHQGDAHGFPMSSRVSATGILLNITARMMAVQAPYNWSNEDSERFFTRHFYRALLQKIFLDRGVVEPPSRPAQSNSDKNTSSLLEEISLGETSNVAALGTDRVAGGATQPVIIGSLRKACYEDFTAYVRGAVGKLSASSPKPSTMTKDGEPQSPTQLDANAAPSSIAELVSWRMSPAHITDEEIQAYEARYAHRKKHLSIVWSLMAFSATLVEAVIVVDRWLWLREQMHEDTSVQSAAGNEEPNEARQKVKWAWVQSVFEYSQSPRNLAVMGIKG